jgi:L-lactate utilization protein LutC
LTTRLLKAVEFERCFAQASQRLARSRRQPFAVDVAVGTIIARKAEHATEVIVRLAKARGAKAVVCGREKRRENLGSRVSKPKRIQRSGAKGWKMPANAIYEKAVKLYEQHLADNFNERDIRHCLRDKDLACSSDFVGYHAA